LPHETHETTRTNAIADLFVTELRDKHGVDDAIVLVGDAVGLVGNAVGNTVGLVGNAVPLQRACRKHGLDVSFVRQNTELSVN
jgi:hypothetical protein